MPYRPHIASGVGDRKNSSFRLINSGSTVPMDQPLDIIRPTVIIVEPDAHGQAALILAESILHALVESAVLTNAVAIDIVQRAIDVKREVATLAGESHGRMQQSLDLLARISTSLATDEMQQQRDGSVRYPRLV